MNTSSKAVVVCLLFLFSVLVTSVHRHGLFPSLLAVTLLSLAVVIGTAIRFRLSFSAVLGFIIGIAVIFRLIVFLYPATLIGVDTDLMAYWTAEVIHLGSIEGVYDGFYQAAPLHYIYSGIISEIISVSAASAFVVYPLLVGIVIPLTTVLLTRALVSTDPYLPSLVAATIAAVSTALMQQSYWPIAQTYSVIIWCIVLVVLVTYLQQRSWRYLLVFVLCVVALAYSHKLPVMVLLGLLGTTSVISLLFLSDRQLSTLWMSFSNYKRPEYALSIISGMILFLHWGYVSFYINDVIRRLGVLLTAGTLSPPSSPTVPTSVSPVNPGIIGEFIAYPNSLALFFERSHAVVLLLVAGCCWLYVFYATRFEGRFEATCASLVLGGTAFGVMLTGIGVISIDAINPNRPLMMIEPLMAVLVGVSFVDASQFLHAHGDKLLILATILLVFTQLFTAPVIADYPNTPRYYLTEAEADGRSFGCEYTDQTVYSDWYVVQEEFIDGNHCDNYESLDRYNTEQPLFNASIDSGEYEMVAYRPSVDVYLGTHNRWRLTWVPEHTLSRGYSNVYTNGEFSIYNKGTASNI